jgi:D-3-phosphoglycerate dehydrogenase
MADTVENLILDLLEWLGRGERTYRETMDAWRTSCPRFPVWEDATDRGLVETQNTTGCSVVRVTPAGLALLKERRARSYEELWTAREL